MHIETYAKHRQAERHAGRQGYIQAQAHTHIPTLWNTAMHTYKHTVIHSNKIRQAGRYTHNNTYIHA